MKILHRKILGSIKLTAELKLSFIELELELELVIFLRQNRLAFETAFRNYANK